MTQTEKIYEYIKTHGSITQREALDLGIMRLASRISDMKKADIKIKTEDVKVRNRDGSYSYIARYSFLKETKNG